MKLLFVGSAFSVHTPRWLAQLQDTGWDLHFFDPTNGLIHEELRDVTLYTGWQKAQIPPGTRVISRWPFLRGRHFIARRLPFLWRAIQHFSRVIQGLLCDVDAAKHARGFFDALFFTQCLHRGPRCFAIRNLGDAKVLAGKACDLR